MAVVVVGRSQDEKGVSCPDLFCFGLCVPVSSRVGGRQ